MMHVHNHEAPEKITKEMSKWIWGRYQHRGMAIGTGDPWTELKEVWPLVAFVHSYEGTNKW